MNTIQLQKHLDILVQRLVARAEKAVSETLRKPDLAHRVLARKQGLKITADFRDAEGFRETILVPSFQIPFLEITPEDRMPLNQIVLQELDKALRTKKMTMHQTREVVCVIVPDPSRKEYVDNEFTSSEDYPSCQ